MAPIRARTGDDLSASSMDMARTWIRSAWVELLPEEATWIYLLAVTERDAGSASVRDAVSGIDAAALEWLDQPVTPRPSGLGARPPATVAELARLMRDLGLLRSGGDGWRAAWPLPDPPIG
jgi:hypothetical protein